MLNSPRVGLLALVAGVVLLACAGVSMHAHKHQVVLLEDEASLSTPPLVLILCFVGWAVAVLGATVYAGPLRQKFAAPDAAAHSLDSVTTRPEFVSFNHRGKFLARAAARVAAQE